MMIHFRKTSPFANLIFGLPLLKVFTYIIVEITHSTDEHRNDQVGNYYPLLDIFVQKQRKNRTLLFVLIQVEKVEHLKEGPGLSSKKPAWKGVGLWLFVTNASAA